MKIRALMALLCLVALIGPLRSVQADAASSDKVLEGFVISADRVDGGMMVPQVVMGETAAHKQKPLIRFEYRNATLYGMQLTKVLSTPQGPMTVVMKANGPVHLTNLTVDASAFSLKGACLKAGKTVPDLGLKEVTMLVHQMQADQGELSQLQLSTIKGNHDLQRPDAPEVLQDLASLPFLEAKDAITSIMKGHLPLTCEDQEKKEKTDEKNSPVEKLLPDQKKPAQEERKTPIDNSTDKVTKPIKDTIDRTKEPLKEVEKPVDDTIYQVKKPVKEVTDSVPKVIKDTKKHVTQITQPVKKTLEPTKQQLCQKATEAKGKIPQQLGLDLIHSAQKEEVPLAELCSDKQAEKQLTLLQNQLLKNMDLLSLLKDEEELASPALFEKMEKQMKKHGVLKLIPDLLKPLDDLFS